MSGKQDGWLLSAVLPEDDGMTEGERISGARDVVRRFSRAFNDENVAEADACLHFPHLILAGEKLITWNEPGQMSGKDFDELRAKGWARSDYGLVEAVLTSPRKVHLLVEYDRVREDGSVISAHHNLWVATWEGGRWGIKLRSY